jgi:hypothetical protein
MGKIGRGELVAMVYQQRQHYDLNFPTIFKNGNPKKISIIRPFKLPHVN